MVAIQPLFILSGLEGRRAVLFLAEPSTYSNPRYRNFVADLQQKILHGY
jgi:hypothetical protein